MNQPDLILDLCLRLLSSSLGQALPLSEQSPHPEAQHLLDQHERLRIVYNQIPTLPGTHLEKML